MIGCQRVFGAGLLAHGDHNSKLEDRARVIVRRGRRGKRRVVCRGRTRCGPLGRRKRGGMGTGTGDLKNGSVFGDGGNPNAVVVGRVVLEETSCAKEIKNGPFTLIFFPSTRE